ncbi:hypothetical protein B0H19DRAFT_1055661 [Mycena capillaripes]|nr:hypothetical protein B0H19DRAFT_1055661 [Mycena capillaripes]
MAAVRQNCSQAQLEALGRYQAKHRDELRRKARERMARRRRVISQSEELSAQHRLQARENSTRYRDENHAMLAHKQWLRRARQAIAKEGYITWHARYKRCHSHTPPVENPDREPTPEPPMPPLEVGDWDREHDQARGGPRSRRRRAQGATSRGV